MKLRSHLVILVLATLVPMVLFSTVMVALFGRDERRIVERELRQTARALALAVDRELDSSATTLAAMATSTLLDRGDLQAFYDFAQHVRPTQREWRLVFLVAPDGAEVMNTARPITASLPSLADREYVQKALATGKPQVSGLLRDRVTGETMVINMVPVRREDRVRYLLAAGQGIRTFGDLFAEQKIAEGWTAAILDQHKRIVARSRSPERFIGESATPGLSAQIDRAAEGAGSEQNKEGQPTFGAYSRAQRSGWTVVIGVPSSMVSSASRRSVWMVIAGGATLLLVAIASAILVGQRIAAPIRGLSDAAQALRHLQPATASGPSCVREVTEVAAAIDEAAAMLRRQAEERGRAEQRIRFQARLLEVVENAVIATDAAGRVTYWNPAAEHLYGWKASEIIGRDIGTVMPPGAVTTWSGDVMVRRRDGTVVPALVASTSIAGDDGRVVGFVSVATDISERKQAEEERAQHLVREREATMRAEFLGQVMLAQEDERARLARELHDGTAQSLAVLLLRLRLLREAASPAVMRERVDALETVVSELLAEVRQIAFALRPAILDDLGLATALERYIDSVSGSRGIPVEVSIAGFEGERLPRPVEVGLYRIVQEALNNTFQHAAATKATVILERGERSLHLAVSDDGVGFDVAAPRTASGRRHFGLQSIAERTALLGGLLVIDSLPGRGTSILIEIPLGEAANG